MNHIRLLKHVLPDDRLGPLKDRASQVAVDSARLEGSVAPDTARGLGEQLRLLNAYHSNLIEGHKTGIMEIRDALEGEYAADDIRRYAQELCAAHVTAERDMMDRIAAGQADPFDADFLPWLHRVFYSQLPEAHQFCHGKDGFTQYPVMPGHFRDKHVSVDGDSTLGPDPEEVPELFRAVLQLYSPEVHHGDERLLAVLSLHHRLAWIHPFRDGNGRMVRLHTAAALAKIGINTHNLWSLSRGLSRNKAEYYIHLRFADQFEDVHLADFLELCLEQCLDQIQFIGKLLNLETVERRITEFLGTQLELARITRDEAYARVLGRDTLPTLMCEVFRSGHIARMEAYAILGVGRKQGVELVKPLLEKGVLVSDSERGRLRFGFPEDAMPTYFPFLYKREIMRDVEENQMVFTEPAVGLLLQDGDKAKLLQEGGQLMDLGRWKAAYGSLLGKPVQAFIYGGSLQIVPVTTAP